MLDEAWTLFLEDSFNNPVADQPRQYHLVQINLRREFVQFDSIRRDMRRDFVPRKCLKTDDVACL